MQFAHPYWILCGSLVCLALLPLLRWLRKKREEQLAGFAGTMAAQLTRNLSPGMRRVKNGLITLSIFLLFFALARPQYGFKWVEVKRKGIDILFALDTSKSMLAEDIKPNRLARAKLGIMDFVARLEGDRVGMMPFAGSAFLMSPLTLDYRAFETSLMAVDTSIIPQGGTNLPNVIRQASDVLKNDANHKILILLTDGENLEGDAEEAAREAADEGVTIHTVGIGTPAGELVPDQARGGGHFVQDSLGKYVTSRLDEKTLGVIAATTGGIYTPIGRSGQGLERVYSEKLAQIPKTELAEKRQKVPLEKFGWPLTAAILLLLIDYLLPDTFPRRKLPLPGVVSVNRRGTGKLFFALIFFASLFSSLPARADQAAEAYNGEDFITAAELYRQKLENEPDNPALLYNYGSATYKNNMYDDAISSFTDAIDRGSVQLQQKAYYNRGNAYFKKGEESLQGDPQATLSQWRNAATSFEGALALNPQNIQARDNLEYTRARIEELEKQQEQQEQQQKDKGQEPNDNGEQQDEKQQGSGEKDQQQPGEQSQQEKDQGGQESSQPHETQKDAQQQGEEQQSDREDTTDQQPTPDTDSSPQSSTGDDQSRDATGSTQSAQPVDQEHTGMSKEEAENILDAIRGAEGELNFVPGNGKKTPQGRDW